MVTGLPRKLIRVGVCAAVIVAIGNPLADSLGLKYWQPIAYESILPVFAYQHRGRPADVLFLGTSRTACVRPRIVEEELRELTGLELEAYSLAQPAANIAASWWMLRDTTATNGPPRLVVLELNPTSVNANRLFSGELEWYCSTPDLLRLIPSLTDRTRVLSAVKGQLRGWSSLVSWAFLRPGSRRTSQRLAEINRDGGLVLRSERSLAEHSHEKRAQILRREIEEQRHQLLRRFAVGGPTVQALEEIIATSHEEGCRVVLIDPPVHPDYRKAIGERELALFSRFVDALVSNHGLRYHDFNTEHARAHLRLTDADFMDFTHLNSSGAERFSREIARSVILEER